MDTRIDEIVKEAKLARVRDFGEDRGEYKKPAEKQSGCLNYYIVLEPKNYYETEASVLNAEIDKFSISNIISIVRKDLLEEETTKYFPDADDDDNTKEIEKEVNYALEDTLYHKPLIIKYLGINHRVPWCWSSAHTYYNLFSITKQIRIYFDGKDYTRDIEKYFPESFKLYEQLVEKLRKELGIDKRHVAERFFEGKLDLTEAHFARLNKPIEDSIFGTGEKLAKAKAAIAEALAGEDINWG